MHLPAQGVFVFNAFIVTLREAAELLLIAEALRAYLQHEGQQRAMPRLYVGLVTGVLLGSCLALWLSSLPWDPRVSAVATIVLGLFIMTLASGMLATARAIHSRIQIRLAAWTERAALPAVVFSFAAIAAFRESMEVVFLLQSMVSDTDHMAIGAGLALGLTAAAALASAYRKVRARIDILILFQASSLLLSLLAIELLLGGVGRLLAPAQEDVPLGAVAQAMSPFLEGGRWYGWVCGALMLLPASILARAWWHGSARTSAR